MAREDRTERITTRLTPSEIAMLTALADESGLSAADIIRTLVRREYAQKIGDKTPKKRAASK